jgi:hypothetical protein
MSRHLALLAVALSGCELVAYVEPYSEAANEACALAQCNAAGDAGAICAAAPEGFRCVCSIGYLERDATCLQPSLAAELEVVASGRTDNIELQLDSQGAPIIQAGDVDEQAYGFYRRDAAAWQPRYGALDAQSARHVNLRLDANDAPHLLVSPGGQPSSERTWNEVLSVWSRTNLSIDSWNWCDTLVDGDALHYFGQVLTQRHELWHTTNASGAWDAGTAVFTSGDVERFDAVLDAAGALHLAVSYTQGGLGHVDYLDNIAGEWRSQNVAAEIGARGVSIQLDQRGAAHLAIEDLEHADVLYATNASGAWELAPIDVVDAVGDHLSLRLDSNDSAHLLYHDDTLGKAKYARRRAGDAAWSIFVIDRTLAPFAEGTGALHQLEIDRGDRIHVALSSHADAELLYLRSDYPSCAAAAMSGAPAGEYTIDPDGLGGAAPFTTLCD